MFDVPYTSLNLCTKLSSTTGQFPAKMHSNSILLFINELVTVNVSSANSSSSSVHTQEFTQ